jgi:hypothetical protein
MLLVRRTSWNVASAPLPFPSLLKISSNCRTSSPIWLSGLEFAACSVVLGGYCLAYI